MKDSQLDRHLVAHDTCTLALASICGAAGAAVSQSAEAGLVMSGAITFLGIASMRVGPLRRGVNRVALTVREVAR